MALNYNFSKVKDHEALHENQSEWGKTDTLIWLTMAVGLGGITEKNYVEFYARIKFLEKLSGAMAHVGREEYFFTIDDIKRRIGLETNVSNTTRKQFVDLKTKNFFSEIERHEAQKVEAEYERINLRHHA